jgi:hypothetical protein
LSPQLSRSTIGDNTDIVMPTGERSSEEPRFRRAKIRETTSRRIEVATDVARPGRFGIILRHPGRNAASEHERCRPHLCLDL